MAQPTHVADASALLAYLNNEEGADALEAILSNLANSVVVHAANACEVYYDTLRRYGEATASATIMKLRSDSVGIREDMDDAFWMEVGALKVSPGGLYFADCMGIALARRTGCPLLTADHHEMDKLVGTGVVEIEFVR
ncbi:MAG TPA: PIN domain-containing protein [Capsulimonadaceae bacterium]|jgi:PIN domain nuclease of toxin-antitoxin system